MNLGNTFTTTLDVSVWNVIRFVGISLCATSILTWLMTKTSALRAGARMRAGIPVKLVPRHHIKSSLVTESDASDKRLRAIVNLSIITLLIAEIAMEFGSGSTQIGKGIARDVGYENLDPGIRLKFSYVPSEDARPISVPYGSLPQTYSVRERQWSDIQALNLTLSEADVLRGNSGDHELEDFHLPSEEKAKWLRITVGKYPIVTGSNANAICAAGFMWIWARDKLFTLAGKDNLGNEGCPLEVLLSDSTIGGINLAAAQEVQFVLREPSEPEILAPCTTLSNVPATLNIQCLRDGGEPPRVEWRRQNWIVGAVSELETSEVVVDYGEKIEEEEAGEIRSVEASRSEAVPGRQNSLIIRRDRGVEITRRQFSFDFNWANDSITICVRQLCHFGDFSPRLCRKRRWRYRMEAVSAFRALQLSTVNVGRAWAVKESWQHDSDQTRTPVLWLSSDLGSANGYLRSETREVATLSPLFFLGLGLFTAMVVVSSWAHLYFSVTSRNVPASIRAITIDQTRRILAMSNLTRFNCGKIPASAPETLIMQTGDMQCHLETTYQCTTSRYCHDIDAEKGLLLLGRAPSVVKPNQELGDMSDENKKRAVTSTHVAVDEAAEILPARRRGTETPRSAIAVYKESIFQSRPRKGTPEGKLLTA
ncbi:Hypothetical protein CHC_T00008292001 [Chondrus crispus]|uniref:Uncharacterized protein n=1 Tax=Chondrus crispus TaxID=2769 RepID=R7QA10_CHOCR|nr:Hypothetical protein CHC_T00008292001 [Chondrus crispus]CDF34310.1 Hypothetical protein CHC_T00008292001 [Chondrus crispus]|eukprot:XP_005714129.1 Hypothetical protein CHC_T00008292001 [Chondrus crispus]